MEKPKSTAELVKEEINSSLYLKKILKKGLINYSALARKILPKIKKKNNSANFSSVLISIQRYYDEIKDNEMGDNLENILKDCELILKNKIISFTFERNKNIMESINKISKNIRWDLGDILFFMQGSGEVTIITDKKNKNKFENIDSIPLEKKKDLAIISLREPEKSDKYSKDFKGFIALLASTLSDNSINILDISSTYKQLIFLVSEKQVTKAYNVLEKLINFYSE